MKTLNKTLLLTGAVMCLPTGAFAQNNTSGTNNTTGSSRTMNRTDTQSGTMNNNGALNGIDNTTGLNNTYSSSAMSRTQIRDVQNALRDRGYSLSADGIWGNQTSTSVRRFQRENNLSATGELDAQTVAALKIKLNNDASGGVSASGNRY